jgi:hypothetical protein
MNKTIALGSTLLALSLAPFANAASILGDIHIAANGTAMVDTTANTVTFSPVGPATNAVVSFRTGDWLNIANLAPASYANLTYSPLSVAAVGGWAAGTLFLVDANSYFVLNSITSVDEGTPANPVLGLQGLGTAFHDAFTPTPGLWSFSANSSGAAFSFSSTTQVPPPGVPDGGTTVTLLGLALAGLAVARRKLNA